METQQNILLLFRELKEHLKLDGMGNLKQLSHKNKIKELKTNNTYLTTFHFLIETEK